jgi:metallo-beta-lactamase family protein
MSEKHSLQIHFLGASGTVTGSKYLLKCPGCNILVDCGLFQGLKKLRELNWQQLPVNASDIDYLFLTHGHLDHTGYLPRLVSMGFKGAVWGTPPTLDITEIILRDSAKIQEEDAERANKDGFTKHSPAEPLYNTLDVEKTLRLFTAQPVDKWIKINQHIRMRFRHVGHILGATFIELDVDGKRLVFSGDVGRKDDLLLRDPVKPEQADILFLESTYGDRIHPEQNSLNKLKDVIRTTTDSGGTLIIPSFAVERAQLLMYLIYLLHIEKSISSSLPVILDSPMAISALSVFRKHPDWHKLSNEQCIGMTERVTAVQSFSETIEIIHNPIPKIIIAGSGMVGGGRVLSYLEHYVGKEETTVLLAGFQAEGTRGRQLMEGADEIKFFGKYHKVKAKVDMLEGLSAHADRDELLDWISEIQKPPDRLFLTHGEPHSLDALRVKIRNDMGWEPEIPELYDIVDI